MTSSRSPVLDEIIRACADCQIAKYCFFKDDGSILETTMSDDVTGNMSKFVKFYSRQMLINNYIVQNSANYHLILYRISQAVFMLVISARDVEIIVNKLMVIFQHFSDRLDKEFHDVPDNFKQITRYIVISQALDMGPEPVHSFPEETPQDILMKIAMKSMLMLTNEREGAVRGIPATIPFIEYRAMGVIFLFDVPDPAARGGAYDSCISILVDESYRPVIYENMFTIENLCIEAAEAIRQGKTREPITQQLLDGLASITLRKGDERKATGSDIASLMKDQLKRISREFK